MPDLDTEVQELGTGQDDALMEAAFQASASGTEMPAVPASAPAVVEPSTPVAQETKAEPATPPAPPASLTPEQLALLATIPQLEQRLTQQVDKVAGNYGEVKRLLESVKKAAATPEGAANADEEWAELNSEFPELTKGVSKGVSLAVQRAMQQFALSQSSQTALTPEQVREAIAAERQAERQRSVDADLALLDKIHPDRMEIQQAPEWKQWLDTLPEIRRAKLLTTYDLEYVADRLTEFKEFRAKKQAEQKKSQNRIEAAVAPQGTRTAAPSSLSEAEEMQKAFAEAANS